MLYEVRQQLGLSWNEYIYLDMVQKLQLSKGWCFKSLENCASDLGFTKRGTIKMRDRLIELKLLDRNDKGNVRVTDKYIGVAVNSVHRNESQNGVFVKRSVNSVPKSVNSVHRIGELSSKITGGENNKRITREKRADILALGSRGTHSPAKERLRSMVQSRFSHVEAAESTQNTQGDGDPTLGTRSRDKRAAASRMLANPAQYPGRDGLALFLGSDAVVRDGDGRR